MLAGLLAEGTIKPVVTRTCPPRPAAPPPGTLLRVPVPLLLDSLNYFTLALALVLLLPHLSLPPTLSSRISLPLPPSLSLSLSPSLPLSPSLSLFSLSLSPSISLSLPLSPSLSLSLSL